MGVITNWIRTKSENNNPKKSEISEEPTTKIDDFPKIFFGKMIKIILQEEKETAHKYVGGNFSINYEDSEHYSCSYELYFQDDNEELYKTEQKSKPLSNEKLFPEARKELAEEKIITFEIPEPSQAERDVYSGEVSLKDAFRKIFDQLVTQKK